MPPSTLQEAQTEGTTEAVESVARRLADEAAQDPLILRTYWFTWIPPRRLRKP